MDGVGVVPSATLFDPLPSEVWETFGLTGEYLTLRSASLTKDANSTLSVFFIESQIVA